MADIYIKPGKLTKIIPSISYTQFLGTENSKKSAIKCNENGKLFAAGRDWYFSKKELSDAQHSYKFDNREMTDDEFKTFKRGFMYMARADAYTFGKKEVPLETLPIECVNNKEYMDLYIEGRGFTCGYNGVAVHELPTEFVGKKAFLIGYRKGIEEKSKLTEKTSKKK